MTHNYRDYISIRNYLKYLMANHIIAMYTLLIPVSTQILSNILRSKLLRCPELLSSCAQSPSGSSAVQTFESRRSVKGSGYSKGSLGGHRVCSPVESGTERHAALRCHIIVRCTRRIKYGGSLTTFH